MLDLSGDERVLLPEPLREFDLVDELAEARGREDDVERVRAPLFVDAHDPHFQAVNGEPVRAAHEPQTLPLQLVERIQLVEPLLMEREILLERRKPGGEVADLLLEVANAAADGLDLVAQRPLPLARLGDAVAEVGQLGVDLLLPLTGTANGRRGENERENEEEGRRKPPHGGKFAPARARPAALQAAGALFGLTGRVRLGNLRRCRRSRLARRRIRLGNIRRGGRIQLARRRVRLGDVRLRRWLEITHAAPFRRLECAECLCGLPPQYPHLAAVILVRDLAASVVELELFERGERSVAALEQVQAAPLRRGRLVQLVVLRLRIEQERTRDEEDACEGQRGAEHERHRHARAAA